MTVCIYEDKTFTKFKTFLNIWFLNIQNMGAGSMQVLLQTYFP